jgi:hypothetical protein
VRLRGPGECGEPPGEEAGGRSGQAVPRAEREGSGPRARKEERMAQYEAYCVKDRKKVQFEGEVVTLKNGRKAAKGKCPECGTTVMRILGSKDAAAS